MTSARDQSSYSNFKNYYNYELQCVSKYNLINPDSVAYHWRDIPEEYLRACGWIENFGEWRRFKRREFRDAYARDIYKKSDI